MSRYFFGRSMSLLPQYEQPRLQAFVGSTTTRLGAGGTTPWGCVRRSRTAAACSRANLTNEVRWARRRNGWSIGVLGGKGLPRGGNRRVKERRPQRRGPPAQSGIDAVDPAAALAA